jgi:4-hydroxybenzoate polyprenyltransferase
MALWLASGGLPAFHWIWIFVLGIFVMRSAGDIINDIADRHWDGRIARTRLRPLVTGRIKVRNAWMVFVLLLFMAVGLLWTMNGLTWIYACVGLGLACVYPLMKRWTSWPQLILGMAYNWGMLMAFSAIQGQVPWNAWGWWLGTVCWCIAYDTEYALADRADDLQVGIKSTAVLFGRFAPLWIGCFQGLGLILYAYTGWASGLGWIFQLCLGLTIPFFVHQQTLLPGCEIKRCIRAFNLNVWPQVCVLLGVLLGLGFR